MLRLSQGDWGLVLALIEKIHACRLEEEFPKLVVTELAKLVPAQHVIWNYMAPTVPAAWTVSSPVIEDNERRTALFAEHMRDHPVVQHMVRTGDPSPRAISDFWSERRFHRAPIYNALYRDMSMEDQLGFWLSGLAPEMVGIGFARDSRGFTERERALLGLLRPHLAQAWRNVRAFGRVRRLALTRRRANAWLGQTVVALGANGRVTRLPGRARQWLREFFSEQLPFRTHLPSSLKQWIAARIAANDANSLFNLPNGPVVCDRDGYRLTVRLFPNVPGWLLVLEKLTHPAAAQWLCQLGLTPREIAVLAEVEKGRTNKEIAAALFISPLTARKHLENIFNKLGVTSRTEAVSAAHNHQLKTQ